MRKLLALVPLLLILAAGCTAPPLVTPAASATAVPTAAPAAPGGGTPVALATGVRGAAPATSDAIPLAGTPSAPVASDGTGPSLTITIDPPEVAWDSQSTITVRASDPAGIKEIDVLLGDQLLATGDGEELQLDFIPGAIDGLKGGASYKLIARATDLGGNAAETSATIKVGPEPASAVGTIAALATASGSAATTLVPATAPPAAQPAGTPEVPAASTPSAAVASPVAAATLAGSAAAGTSVVAPSADSTTSYRVTEINLPTYPYAAYLKQTTDPDREDYPVWTLDRAAYEASNPQPQMKTYRLLVLENRYLRLSILPDLGGRIYECIFKPTGANEFYSNPVIKPTSWGPPSPPYAAGANWWPAAGGLEWGFPVEEHGYEFGTVWGFDHATQDDGGVMVTVYTQTGPENPYAVVDIILPPDTAYFVVQPRVVNPLGSPFKFKFWDNAMLAPGKANSVSPDLRLVFPANQVTVHSTGDPALPQAGQTMAWPVVNGKDLSRLGNWQNYLGVFATPPTATSGTGAFAGVYDPAVDEGMVRVFPADIAKGVKLFAPRGAAGLDPKLWTDDGSTYVELHGGLAPTFADWYELQPGGRRHVERVLVSRGQDRRPDLRQRPRGVGAHALRQWRASRAVPHDRHDRQAHRDPARRRAPDRPGADQPRRSLLRRVPARRRCRDSRAR